MTYRDRTLYLRAALIAGVALLAMTGGGAVAGEGANGLRVALASDGKISAGEAARIVRAILVSQGFSRELRPGGAQIGNPKLQGRDWIVPVTLRGSSLAKSEGYYFCIDSHTGRPTASAAAVGGPCLQPVHPALTANTDQ